MFKTIKKVWRYIRKNKLLLTISITTMLIVQGLNFLSPLIVKSIMDDYLIGIENVWYETTEETEVFYNNKYYTQTEENNNGAMVLIHRNNYYFVDEIISKDFVSGNKKIDYDDNTNVYVITLKNQKDETLEFEGIKLSKSEVQMFYGPFISPLKILVILLAIRLILQIL